MENPNVSVIVPVYCAELYLETCVNSLLGQTLENMEIILVDDGSPDRCGELADGYAEKYPNIHVIHQTNAGQGAARNAGISMAKGTYLAFVDSDDWVKEEMYQTLYEEAIRSDSDIVVSGHCDVADGRIVISKPHPLAGKVLSAPDEIEQIRCRVYGVGLEDQTVEAFPMSACTSLYRRSMIEDHALRFPDGLSEDLIFNLRTYRCARRISFLSAVDYCYRKENQPSLTYTLTDSKRIAGRDFLIRLKEMAEEETLEECRIRSKRSAIDYCRLYVGIVDHACLPLQEKVRYVAEFAEDEAIKDCWAGYPIHRLPVQQKVFHRLIERRWYAAALYLSHIRQIVKKGL